MRQQTTSPAATTRPHSYTGDEELDLSGTWEPARHAGCREAMRAYVEKEMPHLLRSYDPEFLLDAVESTRARLQGR